MVVVPVVEFERYISYTKVFCNTISKFRYKQELCPVVLFVMNKNSKVSLYYTILLLNLAIDLRVKGSREPLFNAYEVAQGEPELRSEY